MILHGEETLSGGEATVTVDADGRNYVVTGLAGNLDENFYWTEKQPGSFKIKSSNGASGATVGWKARPLGIRLHPATLTPTAKPARPIVLNSPLVAVTRRFAIVGISYDTDERHMTITAEEVTVDPIVVTEEGS